jgi:hypothetical protein
LSLSPATTGNPISALVPRLPFLSTSWNTQRYAVSSLAEPELHAGCRGGHEHCGAAHSEHWDESSSALCPRSSSMSISIDTTSTRAARHGVQETHREIYRDQPLAAPHP